MIKNGIYTLYVDKEFNGGLFDVDEQGNISKVLKMFGVKGDKDIVEFSRFPYSSNGDINKQYCLATEKDLEKYGCTYFNEDGSRPYLKDCKKCKDFGFCFLSEDKMNEYKRNAEEVTYKCNEYYENGIPQ
jgi:hypothetical protein